MAMPIKISPELWGEDARIFTEEASRNSLQRKIPQQKHHRSYPAVLIGRLGVNKLFRGQRLNVGTQLMNALKYWFVDENNKAACRYMLVDAYNTVSTIALLS